MSKRKVAGILMFIWSAIFVHVETVMFGSNFYPASLNELVCDGISLAVCLYGCYLILTK